MKTKSHSPLLRESEDRNLGHCVCVGDPLVRGKEGEKRSKYQELAADFNYQGWSVPEVIIDLGSMGKLREDLKSTKLFTKHQVTILCQKSSTKHQALQSALSAGCRNRSAHVIVEYLPLQCQLYYCTVHLLMCQAYHFDNNT